MPNEHDVDALMNLTDKLKLRPEQIAVAHYMAMPKAKRKTTQELAAELGVDHTTVWRWQQNKRVLTLAKELMKRYFVNDLADILEAMKLEALKGNTQAARLVIEYIEDYMKMEKKTDSSTTVNVFISKEDVQSRIKELREKIIDV